MRSFPRPPDRLVGEPEQPSDAARLIESAQVAARRLGLEIIVVNAGNENEIEGAFANAVQQQAAALFVGADAFLSSRQNKSPRWLYAMRCPRVGHSVRPLRPAC